MISILFTYRLIYFVTLGTKTSIYQPIPGHLNTYQYLSDLTKLGPTLNLNRCLLFLAGLAVSGQEFRQNDMPALDW